MVRESLVRPRDRERLNDIRRSVEAHIARLGRGHRAQAAAREVQRRAAHRAAAGRRERDRERSRGRLHADPPFEWIRRI